MIQGAKGIIDACSPQFPLKTITSLDIYHFFLNKVHSFSLNWTYASNFYNLLLKIICLLYNFHHIFCLYPFSLFFVDITLLFFRICPFFLFFVDIMLLFFAYVHCFYFPVIIVCPKRFCFTLFRYCVTMMRMCNRYPFTLRTTGIFSKTECPRDTTQHTHQRNRQL